MGFLHQNQGSLRLRDLVFTHFFGKSHTKSDVGAQRQYSSRTCRVCGKSHGAWACPEFKQMNVQNRWASAKQNKFCFCCLGEGHQGQFCNRMKVCGINNCKEVHHRLLHSGSSQSSTNNQTNEIVSEMNEEIQPLRQQEVKAGESSTCGEGEPKEKSQKEGTFTTVITKKGDTPGTIALNSSCIFKKWAKKGEGKCTIG